MKKLLFLFSFLMPFVVSAQKVNMVLQGSSAQGIDQASLSYLKGGLALQRASSPPTIYGVVGMDTIRPTMYIDNTTGNLMTIKKDGTWTSIVNYDSLISGYYTYQQTDSVVSFIYNQSREYTDSIVAAQIVNSTFGGSVTPSSNPAPSVNTYYFATQPGIYTNMGGFTVPANTFAIISYNASGSVWSITQTPIDLSTVLGYKYFTRQLNIYDKSKNVTGRVVNATTGVFTANTNGEYSGLQQIDATKTYVVNFRYDLGTAVPRVWYYDVRNVALSFQDFSSSGSHIMNIPNQATQFAFTVKASNVVWQNKDSVTIEEYGSLSGSYPSPYSTFGATGQGRVLYSANEIMKTDQAPPSQYVPSNEIGGLSYSYGADKPLFTTRQLNIFDKSKLVTGSYVDGNTGGIVINATSSYTGFQPIDPTKKYFVSKISFSISTTIRFWYFNYKQVPISYQEFTASDNPTLTPPTNASYFAFTVMFNSAVRQNVDSVMIEEYGTVDNLYPTQTYSSFGTLGNGRRLLRLNNYFLKGTDSFPIPPLPPIPSGTTSIEINPNQFSGMGLTDIGKIRAAVNLASLTVNSPRKVVIGYNDERGAPLWLIDSAIILPSNITIVIKDTKIKISDTSRDNIFRSGNCGYGIVPPYTRFKNINIIGEGNAILEGASNPRSTGDNGKTLALNPTGNQTYGRDAGVIGQTQTGDWRNIGILMANVDGVEVRGIFLNETHAWGMSFEYCTEMTIDNNHIESSPTIVVNGVSKRTRNKDGIDIRTGCQKVRISNISGDTDDDIIAMTGLVNNLNTGGLYGFMQVAGGVYLGGGKDDMCKIQIKNVTAFSAANIVRILNIDSIKAYNIVIDGVVDVSTTDAAKKPAAAVVIGSLSYGGSTFLGDTRNIIINNIISRAGDNLADGGTIQVLGSLSESIISNVIRYNQAGSVITYHDMGLIRNVNTSNCFNYTVP